MFIYSVHIYNNVLSDEKLIAVSVFLTVNSRDDNDFSFLDVFQSFLIGILDVPKKGDYKN